MLPNSPDFVRSLPIQDRKPNHPDRHFKNPDLTKIRCKGKGCVALTHNIVPEVNLHLGLTGSLHTRAYHCQLSLLDINRNEDDIIFPLVTTRLILKV